MSLRVWEGVMSGLIRMIAVSAILLLIVSIVMPPKAIAVAADEHDSLVITYKDGHRQSFAKEQIARIDFKAPATLIYKDGHREKLAGEIEHIDFDESALGSAPGRSHFLGKWEVGQGNGGGRFFITLESNGDAKKSIGSRHGTWTLVDGEARISWDDGWHDVIRKVGNKHEKVAFEPGRSFNDSPSNITPARNTEQKPI